MSTRNHGLVFLWLFGLSSTKIAVHNDFYTQLPHPMFSSLCRSSSLVSECWSSSRGRVSCRSARDLGSPAAALSLNVLGQGAWEGSEELRDSVTASALPQKSSTSSFINADTTNCAQHRVCAGEAVQIYIHRDHQHPSGAGWHGVQSNKLLGSEELPLTNWFFVKTSMST